MSTLGPSLKERVVSRILFYLCVTATMWILGRVVPEQGPAHTSGRHDAEMIRPLMGVPVSNLTFSPPPR